MSQRTEDYALIGDTHTAALVGRDGSIDWLCVPRFDSSACFAALLGTPEHGRWLLAPNGAGPATRRAYRGGTLVLDQEWDTESGTVRVTDFMPPRQQGEPPRTTASHPWRRSMIKQSSRRGAPVRPAAGTTNEIKLSMRAAVSRPASVSRRAS